MLHLLLALLRAAHYSPGSGTAPALAGERSQQHCMEHALADTLVRLHARACGVRLVVLPCARRRVVVSGAAPARRARLPSPLTNAGPPGRRHIVDSASLAHAALAVCGDDISPPRAVGGCRAACGGGARERSTAPSAGVAGCCNSTEEGSAGRCRRPWRMARRPSPDMPGARSARQRPASPCVVRSAPQGGAGPYVPICYCSAGRSRA